ncbi:MAG: SDR family oxidoreductase [Myxococcota bacterium]
MRVFITGGSGFVGSAIVPELLAAGHVVTGLARSAEAAERLAAAGVAPHRGDLTDLADLRAAAAAADAVIHCAFVHDFTNLAASAVIDLHAAEAMIDGLASGAGKVLITTSGTALLAGRGLAHEDDAVDPSGHAAFRLPTETAVRAAAARGVRSAVMRLPPSVHGAGDHGFAPFLIDIARRSGVSAYQGSGENRWPSVHREDAAILYRMALERLADGTIPAGSALHANAEEGVPMRDIAGAIAAQLGLGPPEPRPAEHFGWFARFAALDNPTSSARTAALTGWRPTRPGLLEDLRGPACAAAANAR